MQLTVKGARGLLAVAAGLTAFCAAGTAFAEDPIETRQMIMKNNGAATKAAAAMVKGEVPYDALRAELAMRVINSSALAFGHYFPEDSKSGGDTEAAPKIWEDMEGFMHEVEELAEHSSEGIEAAGKGLEEFKSAFAETVKYCKSCHQTYRIKK